MFATQLSDASTQPPPVSTKRQRLTNFERANRLARRIFDVDQKPVIILYTGNPLQQYRLVVGEDIKKLELNTGEFDISSLIASYI